MARGLSRLEGWIIGGVIVALFAFLFALVATAGWWMRLDSLHVADARVGQPVPIEYHRTFLRDFQGEWQVAIWQMERGNWEAFCAVSDRFPYRARTPDPLQTLEWLVDGDTRCSRLPPGTYQAEVTVTANPGTLLARSETLLSNPFTVSP